MKIWRKKIVGLLGGLGMVVTLSSAASAGVINGAGATFPYPLYSQWFYSYQQQTGVKINYQSIGSGAGIQQVKVGTVDFGASDAPLTKEDLSANNLVQFPMVGGAVAITYNVPGLGSGLKLTSPMIADIYLGKITRWNDPAIVKLNPKAKLPDIPVIVVHRSDGSGTTNIFTWFLSDVSAKWKTGVGAGTSVKWPVGLGGKGNEGVAGLVKQTNGAIGYVELAYALQAKMAYALVENRAGKFVYPSIETTKAAAAETDIPDHFYVKFTYEKGENSYPIAGFTYLLFKKSLDPQKRAALIQFVEWAYQNGDGAAAKLHYVPLSNALKNRVLAALKKL
ncbi:MAG: phosphate ABC transporter substrate-binding protein PstS [Candidatus Omnitrophota bacterium]